LELRELINEFEKGKENWAYSCDPNTGKIVPGVINWAGVTRSNTAVIKLTLDNGKSLICTPDHKIPVFGKGFVEAQHLTDQDNLISFTTRTSKISPDSHEYEQVWDHEINQWALTHSIVGEFFRERNKHQEFTYLEENIGKLKTSIHHRDANGANNDPRNLTYMNEQDHILFRLASNQLPKCKNSRFGINFLKSKCRKLVNLLIEFQYKNYKTSVSEINKFNHKIVKVEMMPNRDVGTITIDGSEKWHNFHTFAIESGIFVKNSVNEDYFFPQTAEGRGSKVETLPGGTNLGEITDLRYFTNKLFRALRIPSAYLPTSVDEAPNALSDGKVGTAYIQELRFNEYCKRLQNMVVETFDLEFKIWLESNGVNIDPGLFELKFNPPQNFAAYRQAELDTQRVALFAQLQEIPYLSKRFSMKRFLGMSEEEIKENERMWREENGDTLKPPAADGSEMRGVGVSLGGLGAEAAGQTADASPELAADAEAAAANTADSPSTV
jgi:post-segregation antitoxin (ccd killing protein)